ncbi:MAG: HAD-IC family P-type ATPase, partial [bacterium]
LSAVHTIVFDKTGTLTNGKPEVTDVIVIDSRWTENKILQMTASIEKLSEHPLAEAIVLKAEAQKIDLQTVENFIAKEGIGVEGTINGQCISVQKPNKNDQSENILQALQKEGKTVVVLSIEQQKIGYIAMADTIKLGAKESIEKLQKKGITIVMLTGDNPKIAAKIAAQTGIDDFHADLLPENKVDYVRRYLSPKYKVAMVGDGVNDAAPLALADIGIAMGAIGSDTAIESADLVLMKDDLSRLPEMIKLSRYVMRVAYQNFWIWGVVNMIGLVLVFQGVLNPAGAAAFNFITDFFPLINSLRLFQLHLSPHLLQTKVNKKC